MSWRTHLRLGRVSNLPTVWTNVLAGAVLAGAELDPATLSPLFLALSLFYVGGMYLNDAFDRETDARERPERPIPSGAIGAPAVFRIGYGMFAAALLILALLAAREQGGAGWEALASGAALAAAITYYDARHETDPFGPIVMGLCRALVYVTAAFAAAGSFGIAVAAGALVLLAYVAGLTYIARQETLSRARHLWPLILLAAPFLYGFPSLRQGLLVGAAYAALLAWVGFAVWLLARPARPNIPRAVAGLIAGISLLDALLIAGASGSAGLVVLAWLGFALTLLAQRFVPGT